MVLTPPPCGGGGSASVPATPAMQYYAQTPTGTPAYGMQYQTYQVASTPMAGEHRQTLSLTSMIQSPKAEEKMVMNNQAYQQYQQYQQYQHYTTTAPAPGAAPQYTVVQGQRSTPWRRRSRRRSTR